VVLVPSAFTVPTGRAHWEVLLRARAIETQSFVLAAAQVKPNHSFLLATESRIVHETQLRARHGKPNHSFVLATESQITASYSPRKAEPHASSYPSSPRRLSVVQVGHHNAKRCSWGEAIAVDPWGKVLGKAPSFDDLEAAGHSDNQVSTDVIARFGRSFL
jgi:predicted amidohydrolase